MLFAKIVWKHSSSRFRSPPLLVRVHLEVEVPLSQIVNYLRPSLSWTIETLLQPLVDLMYRCPNLCVGQLHEEDCTLRFFSTHSKSKFQPLPQTAPPPKSVVYFQPLEAPRSPPTAPNYLVNRHRRLFTRNLIQRGRLPSPLLLFPNWTESAPPQQTPHSRNSTVFFMIP